MKRLLLSIILPILIISACRKYDEPKGVCVDYTPNATISQLRDMCRYQSADFNQDIIFTGTVISSDSEGYITRSIFIDDGSAGIEIMLGIYNSCKLYPEGSKVTVRLQGLSGTMDNHILKVGVRDKSGYNNNYIDYINSRPYIKEKIIRHFTKSEIPIINTAIHLLDSEMCGRIVKIDNLHHWPAADEVPTAGGYHRLSDNAGNTIYINIPETAPIIGLPLPQEEISVTGILSYPQISYNIGEQYVITPTKALDHGM